MLKKVNLILLKSPVSITSSAKETEYMQLVLVVEGL